jgi:ComF family protein
MDHAAANDESIPTRSLHRHARDLLSGCRHGIARAGRLVLDVALPTLCVTCREPVAGVGVCAKCWPQLSFIAPPYCPRLGIPFAYDPGPEVLSMEAIATPPTYQRARAAVRYDEIAKTLVHGLKYQDRTDLAPVMGRWMARAGQDILAEANILVPVPLHWRRGWSRRFNQAGALAKVIAKAANVPVTGNALCRIRATQQQVGLSKSERASNVQGAFAIPPDKKPLIEGRHVVLIDDVLTSGATIDACARTLLRAKARQVDVLVFARVVEGFRNPI